MIRERFKCLIAIRASRRAAANTFFRTQIFNRRIGETFTQGLNAAGTGTPTWYWASLILEKWQIRKLVQMADSNAADIKIVIWPHQKGLKAELTDKMSNRAYITIADNQQNPKDFLDNAGMKIVRPDVAGFITQ